MPIYEYRCMDCGHIFEEYHPLPTDEKATGAKCPKCAGNAPRYFAYNVFSSGGRIDAGLHEDAPEYREMHYYEKKKDWEKAARAAEGVSDFAKGKFLAKAKEQNG